jgi:hypothetical protein
MSSESIHLDSTLDLQVRTSKMLGLGIALSFFPFFGIASFLIGLKGAKTIYFSGIKIRGKIAVWWCIIYGAIGIGVTIYTIPSWFLAAIQ